MPVLRCRFCVLSSLVRASICSSLLLLLLLPVSAQPSNYDQQRARCAIQPGQERTCEECIDKGSDCFWCETSSTCLPYSWYFPGCDFDHVKYNKCWVSISSLVVVACVVGGFLLVIVLACLCYCCCRFRTYSAAQRKNKGAKIYAQEMERRSAAEQRQAARAELQRQHHDTIKTKYGLSAASSSSVGSTRSKGSTGNGRVVKQAI